MAASLAVWQVTSTGATVFLLRYEVSSTNTSILAGHRSFRSSECTISKCTYLCNCASVDILDEVPFPLCVFDKKLLNVSRFMKFMACKILVIHSSRVSHNKCTICNIKLSIMHAVASNYFETKSCINNSTYSFIEFCNYYSTKGHTGRHLKRPRSGHFNDTAVTTLVEVSPSPHKRKEG